MDRRAALALSFVALVCLRASAASAQAASSAGTATAPHPTLENVSIVWPVSGDENADGVVSVRYRAMGEASCRTGLPLRRVPAGSAEGFSWPSQHAGSVFDLRPGTTYEIELSLEDPDGGGTSASLSVTTRAEPTIPADAREVAVMPSSLAAALSAATPGDVLVLGAGSYDGFSVETDGTAARPIVLRGTPGAIVNGEIRLDDRSHVFVEDLEVRDRIVLHGTHHIVVRRVTLTTPDDGVVALGTRGATFDSYVCDNVITGPTLSWVDAAVGADGDNLGEGVQLAGAGNVICRNRVRGFRDCVSTLEDTEAFEQSSIDIVANDLSLCADDAIEADFTMGNVRILRNRVTNSFVGISGQPTLGGPTYSIRNVMFNVVYSPFKLHRGSVGDVALHNTIVKCGDAFAVYAGVAWSRAFFRNNLFLGGAGGGTYGGYENGTGQVMVLADADATCDFDHDGLGSIGTGTFRGRIGDTRFASLAELTSTTTERHAVEVGLEVFGTVPEALTSGPFPERAAPDLRLSAGGAAVDRGTALPNVNDGFAGSAPDLGAYELGSALPTYGPRTAGGEVCGDGAREGAEACDDGNTRDGDGCSAGCTIEAMPGVDAGALDAGAGVDGGPLADAALPPGVDGGPRPDAGGTSAPSAGCACSVPSARATAPSILALGLVLALAASRRRTR
jgi:MYXO-CTERM domain-containing protein